MAFNRPLPVVDPKQVLVLALDFDGCLSNQAYVTKQNELLANYDNALQALKLSATQSHLPHEAHEAIKKALADIMRRDNFIVRLRCQAEFAAKQLEQDFDKVVHDWQQDKRFHPDAHFFADAKQVDLIIETIKKIVAELIPSVLELLIQSRKKLNEAFYAANLAVVKHAKETVQTNDIQLVVGAISSARQSYFVDFDNRRNGSCFASTEAFINRLEEEVGVPCVMYRGLLSDGYGNLLPGSNFSNIVKGEFQATTHWFFDTHKSSIIYTLTHEIRGHFTGKIWFHFLDDKLEYLQHQMVFFAGGYKLPERFVFMPYEYNGVTLSLAKDYDLLKDVYPAVIEGIGIHDDRCNANVRMMVELSYHCWLNPHSADERGAISLYGDNEIKYETERHFSPENLLKELKLQFARWKKLMTKNYSGELINAFHQALDDLYTSIQFDVMEQRKKGYREDEIHLSPALVTARECLRILYISAQERFYYDGKINTLRKNALLQFPTQCGQRTPFVYGLTLWLIQKTSLNTLHQLCVQTPVLSQSESILRYIITSWPISTPASFVGRYANQLLFNTTSFAPKVAAVNQCVRAWVEADQRALNKKPG